MIGEVIRNEKVTPNGTPAFKRLIKIGIEEQEQNGVMAPKSAAIKLPSMPPLPIHFLRRYSGSQNANKSNGKNHDCKQQKDLNCVIEEKM